MFSKNVVDIPHHAFLIWSFLYIKFERKYNIVKFKCSNTCPWLQNKYKASHRICKGVFHTLCLRIFPWNHVYLNSNIFSNIFKAPSPQRGPNSSPHHESAAPPLLPGGAVVLIEILLRIKARNQVGEQYMADTAFKRIVSANSLLSSGPSSW